MSPGMKMCSRNKLLKFRNKILKLRFKRSIFIYSDSTIRNLKELKCSCGAAQAPGAPEPGRPRMHKPSTFTERDTAHFNEARRFESPILVDKG